MGCCYSIPRSTHRKSRKKRMPIYYPINGHPSQHIRNGRRLSGFGYPGGNLGQPVVQEEVIEITDRILTEDLSCATAAKMSPEFRYGFPSDRSRGASRVTEPSRRHRSKREPTFKGTRMGGHKQRMFNGLPTDAPGFFHRDGGGAGMPGLTARRFHEKKSKR